jgi:hypothetical protein
MIKHLEKFLSVLGGHLKSMNTLENFYQGSYAYSLRVGEITHILIGVT